MMTVHVYKYSDDGAPQLSANSASLNQIIKACLVTGYGNKTAAGWQLVYDSQENNPSSTEHRICVRANDLDSTRTYFEFKKVDFNLYGIAYLEASAFDAWTDDNQGLGLINHGARVGINHNSQTGMYMAYHYNLQAPVRVIKWMIIADGKGFYLLLGVNNNQSTYSVGYFGDYISINPTRPQAVIAAFNSANSYNIGGFAAVASNNLSAQGRICLADKKLAALTSMFVPAYGFGNRYNTSIWLQTPINYQLDAGDAMVFSRPMLATVGNNITLVGYLPGLMECPIQGQGQPIDNCWQHIVEGDTVLEMPIQASGTNFINITDWDR